MMAWVKFRQQLCVEANGSNCVYRMVLLVMQGQVLAISEYEPSCLGPCAALLRFNNNDMPRCIITTCCLAS